MFKPTGLSPFLFLADLPFFSHSCSHSTPSPFPSPLFRLSPVRFVIVVIPLGHGHARPRGTSFKSSYIRQGHLQVPYSPWGTDVPTIDGVQERRNGWKPGRSLNRTKKKLPVLFFPPDPLCFRLSPHTFLVLLFPRLFFVVVVWFISAFLSSIPSSSSVPLFFSLFTLSERHYITLRTTDWSHITRCTTHSRARLSFPPFFFYVRYAFSSFLFHLNPSFPCPLPSVLLNALSKESEPIQRYTHHMNKINVFFLLFFFYFGWF